MLLLWGHGESATLEAFQPPTGGKNHPMRVTQQAAEMQQLSKLPRNTHIFVKINKSIDDID